VGESSSEFRNALEAENEGDRENFLETSKDPERGSDDD
jgi:hypothetical protein